MTLLVIGIVVMIGIHLVPAFPDVRERDDLMTSQHTSAQRYALLNRVVTDIVLGDASQEQMQDAFEAVAREIGAECYFHYRVDEARPDQLRLTSFSGQSPTNAKSELAVRKGGQLSSLAAQSRRMLVLENVQEREDVRTEGVRALGATAYLGVPLIAHRALFGTLAFVSTSQPRFSDEDVEFVRLLADQFATALDRARLVDRLRANETRYDNALITGRIAAWETDMVTRTRTWTEEGMALFGLNLPGGRGQIGGENDEFLKSLHPDDKHMMAEFHGIADKVDTYPAEYRIVRPDGSIAWVSGRGRVIQRRPDGTAEKVDNIVVDITDRKRAEENVKLLMREISHRSKNLLAVVQAIAGQTARSAGSLPEFGETFSQRLQGLAASHDLLVKGEWIGATLADLVRGQLGAFAGMGSRLSIDGPETLLSVAAIQSVGMALHELGTNALKHGAWSNENGTVAVSWSFTEQDVSLVWVESGGPPITEPARRGFGSVVLGTMVAQTVDGQVAVTYGPAGLQWTLKIPAHHIIRNLQRSDGTAVS